MAFCAGERKPTLGGADKVGKKETRKVFSICLKSGKKIWSEKITTCSYFSLAHLFELERLSHYNGMNEKSRPEKKKIICGDFSSYCPDDLESVVDPQHSVSPNLLKLSIRDGANRETDLDKVWAFSVVASLSSQGCGL